MALQMLNDDPLHHRIKGLISYTHPLELRYCTMSFSTTACCRLVGPFMAARSYKHSYIAA